MPSLNKKQLIYIITLTSQPSDLGPYSYYNNITKLLHWNSLFLLTLTEIELCKLYLNNKIKFMCIIDTETKQELQPQK